MENEIAYDLQLITTAAATGYFACVPQPAPALEEGFALLRQRPFDDFLRKHLLTRLVESGRAEIEKQLAVTRREDDPTTLSILLEALGIVDEVCLQMYSREVAAVAGASSLVDLRSIQKGDLLRHRPWLALLQDNLVRHCPLPAPAEAGLALPYDRPPQERTTAGPDIHSLFAAAGPSLADSGRRPVQETIELALERLKPLDIFESTETRHASCLSPIGYLRKWRLSVRVHSGRNRYTLSGTQTSYGKGLSPEAARASCLMEVAERLSSFCSCREGFLPDYKQPHRLLYDSYADLCAKGQQALDPDQIRLDVSYRGESLHWIQGRDTAGRATLVPMQAVFLFTNLDEVSLFGSLGSTGLASGNTLEEAKVSALLEVIERDADCVKPFEVGTCFQLYTENPHLLPLFEAYAHQGIQINFQEIFTEFGIPAYRCFVRNTGGEIVKGTGAHLDGRKAVMAALTETPYPFPSGSPTAPGLPNLRRQRFEDLPNYDTNSSAKNLVILETLLKEHGFEPIYVDLTRKDVDIPVVKAIVPGLEWLSDFDRLAIVSPRLWANYLVSVQK
jgi:YcaO-like protein with predicted kinase domain